MSGRERRAASPRAETTSGNGKTIHLIFFRVMIAFRCVGPSWRWQTIGGTDGIERRARACCELNLDRVSLMQFPTTVSEVFVDSTA